MWHSRTTSADQARETGRLEGAPAGDLVVAGAGGEAGRAVEGVVAGRHVVEPGGVRRAVADRVELRVQVAQRTAVYLVLQRGERSPQRCRTGGAADGCPATGAVDGVAGGRRGVRGDVRDLAVGGA